MRMRYMYSERIFCKLKTRSQEILKDLEVSLILIFHFNSLNNRFVSRAKTQENTKYEPNVALPGIRLWYKSFTVV